MASMSPRGCLFSLQLDRTVHQHKGRAVSYPSLVLVASVWTELSPPAERQLFFSAGPFAVKHFISKPLLLFCFIDSEERRTEGNSRKGAILKHKLSLAGCVALE